MIVLQCRFLSISLYISAVGVCHLHLCLLVDSLSLFLLNLFSLNFLLANHVSVFEDLPLPLWCLSIYLATVANMTTAKTCFLFNKSAVIVGELASKPCGHPLPLIIENVVEKNSLISTQLDLNPCVPCRKQIVN